ncbi:MAG: HD domain-containing protein [Lachnospiraceae bacterium]|nr:HD domain-containing protein [Lachnospiraceae bacterium]
MSLEYITSKNLFLLICETLRLIDEKVVDHGGRVGYILVQMLKTKGGYEQFELADLLLLAIMHDIGAYKTDTLSEEFEYDIKNCMPHSIYGYLFMKYLSPQDETAKVLLYHHVGARKMQQSNYKYINLADYLAVAELVDIFRMRYKDKFDYIILEKYIGKRFSKDAYDLLSKADKREKIFERIMNGEYKKDIADLLEYV